MLTLPAIRNAVLPAVLLAVLAVAGTSASSCDDTSGGGGDAVSGPGDADAGPELEPGQSCVPGTVKGCLTEGGTRAMICNESGTQFVEKDCTGPNGEESQCVDGSCTTCFPGNKRCLSDQVIGVCSDDGSEWKTFKECQSTDETKVCRSGQGGFKCRSLCSINAKKDSYIGCDYWAADLDNAFVPGGGRGGYYDAAGAQYAIAVANPPSNAPFAANVRVLFKEGGEEKEVPVDSQGNELPSEPLEPGDLRVYRLPRRDVDGTTLSPLAYRVTASVPIIAYQFNPLENEQVFSNDASLLLPSTQLGKENFVMTREQTFDSLRGQLAVIGTRKGEVPTQVSVRVSTSTMVGEIDRGGGETEELSPMEPGETRIFELEQYDVLSLETNEPGADLTGSLIQSDKRVAVFGASEASNAPNTARCIPADGEGRLEDGEEGVCEWDGETPCENLLDCVSAGFNTCCADHLEQQMFPVRTWGRSYVATKSWDRGQEPDIWRIMAKKDNTKVKLVPPQEGVSVPVLNRGEWFEFESRQDFEIHVDDEEGENKPILVGHYLAAENAPAPNVGGGQQQGDAGTGDPAFMLSVPREQYRKDFVVLVPEQYADNYANITAQTGTEVRIDGEPVMAEQFDPVGQGSYSVHRTPLEPGTHTITADEPVGVIVYGYDQYVSYAYTGGLSLRSLNEETGLGGGAGGGN